ncbi:hypothetical protein PDESU_05820 [Pontiella desulfatans]|uniref:Symporter YjmB n=1 Tax=Pontiella desulfatans TaxID=2750659 RepID=A0A6C2UCX2_PONDE|nr:MFS transporter [Pontiella desulfatans]VGO17224.1 hypothetical protein PDESU_05820 [Pontiella desulfatans]
MTEETKIEQQDAPRKEVICYGVGGLGNQLCMNFFYIVSPILIIALHINPLLVGLIIALKTLWDGVTDPVMAYISDNAKSKRGRRRPFILGGGLSMSVIFMLIWLFLPTGDIQIEPNEKPEPVIEQVAAEQPVETEKPAAEKPAPKQAGRKSVWTKTAEGFGAFGESTEAERTVILYMIFATLLLATAQTVFSVPYYALGIELSPSYHGRTQVVAWRAAFQQIAGLINPWILPFCMLPFFANAIRGITAFSMIAAGIMALTTVLLFRFSKERTHAAPPKRTDANHIGIFKSIGLTLRNVHFLKILVLYLIFQFSIGIFMQLGIFLNIYYVFDGDKLGGAAMTGKIGTLGWALGFAAIPLITWMCKKVGKHNALRAAIVLMIIGSALKWYAINPDHPEYQYILPFFFSLGISSVYTVLSTLMADVTDVDELATGTRREGMFGAVMAFMMKGMGSLQFIAAGAVLVATGFNAEAGTAQADGVFLWMRILYSIVPAVMLSTALLVLHNYPLTAARMQEIKAELAKRKTEGTAS